MKILYPLEIFYPSQAGGTANTVYWIAKYLPNDSIKPVIIATNKGLPAGVPLNVWKETECGKVIYIKTRFFRLPVYQAFVSIRNVLQSDIVHVSSVFFPTSLATAIVAFLFRKKLIWSVHGEFDTYTFNDSAIRKRIVSSLVKKTVGNYATYHSTCDDETGYIKKILGDNVNIIQVTNYFEVPKKYKRNASNHLLFIGRINHKKAIENLIQALSLSTLFCESDFVLKIAGDGKEEYKDELNDLVKQLNLSEKIFFVGQVEGDAKHQLLADAYFTIMPSHTENFGLVVIESLAQETPVIASKGSPWKSLEDEKVGFWVDNSPQELSRILDKILMMDSSEYNAYRERSRLFVIERFDIKNNIDKWVDIYNSLS